MSRAVSPRPLGGGPNFFFFSNCARAGRRGSARRITRSRKGLSGGDTAGGRVDRRGVPGHGIRRFLRGHRPCVPRAPHSQRGVQGRMPADLHRQVDQLLSAFLPTRRGAFRSAAVLRAARSRPCASR
eukprot:1244952-Pyramimonas_sp.AAC.1